ncbi:hypothetical protein [Oscillatoria sp. FACHB-1406]|uniref:hypothetical protein n=1 Tax=Oscillatoria sp. FACHB-1406 TaxID=2692846 RepID=UPI0016820045|nr:hypothetical protein [Oscillatoria sp. FACHB-1406]MBD2580288.1 hypothetical protein [Oscillatoria sp. FACHB-1406]
MSVQFQNYSLKKAARFAGVIGVGLTLAAPALAEDSLYAQAPAPASRPAGVTLTPEQQRIFKDYTPPETETYTPDYRLVELKDVKPYLCSNNSTPDCGFKAPTPATDRKTVVPSYGVNDKERDPGSMVCLNSNNPLCENPLNYGREFPFDTADNFKARTRSLWADLDEALARRRSAPPMAAPTPREPAPVFTPAPQPAPVRGLW